MLVTLVAKLLVVHLIHLGILNIRVWLLLSISPTGYSLHDNNKDVNMFIVYP